MPPDSGSGPPPSNKRRHTRHPLSVLVQFRFETFDDFVAEYASNLSLGGMFIRTDEAVRYEVGAHLQLQFFLRDGGKFIEGLAQVVRVVPPGGPEPAGMGVEFLNFEGSMAVIAEVLESLHPDKLQSR